MDHRFDEKIMQRGLLFVNKVISVHLINGTYYAIFPGKYEPYYYTSYNKNMFLCSCCNLKCKHMYALLKMNKDTIRDIRDDLTLDKLLIVLQSIFEKHPESVNTFIGKSIKFDERDPFYEIMTALDEEEDDDDIIDGILDELYEELVTRNIKKHKKILSVLKYYKVAIDKKIPNLEKIIHYLQTI